MNIVMWMLAGGIPGWVGYSFLGLNERRGMMVSIILGSVGGITQCLFHQTAPCNLIVLHG